MFKVLHMAGLHRVAGSNWSPSLNDQCHIFLPVSMLWFWMGMLLSLFFPLLHCVVSLPSFLAPFPPALPPQCLLSFPWCYHLPILYFAFGNIAHFLSTSLLQFPQVLSCVVSPLSSFPSSVASPSLFSQMLSSLFSQFVPVLFLLSPSVCSSFALHPTLDHARFLFSDHCILKNQVLETGLMVQF